ncbi:TetR family transcriptional regulator [Streptomyces sp. DW26H14]|uniref:TetR family transcriptional regulator n=1 Tax=Streptomyces sp. DW26H14 TaxID=3435395 RepID=UPI00403D7724
MGRRRETPTKGDLREQAILDTAEALLDTEGFEQMTVEAIANGAGISRGALYFYFGSKQDVLAALVVRTMSRLNSAAPAGTEGPAGDPMAAVAEAVRRTRDTWRAHGRVMRAAVEYAALIPEVGAAWNATVEGFAAATARNLVAAGVPGTTTPDGAHALATALCWMTERMFYTASAAAGASGADAGLDRAAATCTEVWRRVIIAG